MGIFVILTITNFRYILALLAVIAGVFVISTKNAIISVFNLIVLYILVAFYLIYIGIAYLGISYIVVYIGAIAILFLFVIMMIDIEVVDRKNNNYLPLLFFLLGGFLLTMKNILYSLTYLRIKSILYKDNDKYFVDFDKEILFNNLSHNISSNNNDNLMLPNTLYDLNYNIENDLLNNYDVNFSEHLISDKFKQIIISTNTNNNTNNNTNINTNNNISMENNTDIPLLIKNDYNDISILFKDLYISSELDNNYLLITPDWDSAVSRITQISAIGDVLYTIYHSFIYIVSVILLLGMVGAIILTADHNHHIRIITIIRNKNNNNKASNILAPIAMIKYYICKWINIKNRKQRISLYYLIPFSSKNLKYNIYSLSLTGIYPFSDIMNNEKVQSEDIISSLIYYAISNIIIGVLLLLVNSSFSLSIKYLDKGGGFECGFTSFLQTRERYNIIFYRVSLLFLVFDLEIILAFPYPAIYQKNQNNSKNNVLAFLYILVIGFIYELKEGALNIVKTAHSSEIKVDY